MRKIQFTNRIWLASVTFISLLATPIMARAADLNARLTEILGYVIWLVMIGPQLVLLQLEMWLLPIVAKYNNFTSLEPVIGGWQIMRDVANMFFVLILLVIAFATIMSIERYGYRSLLRRLIVMSILVNFSMTIVGLLIDLSQVIMLTFVAAIKDVASGNIVAGFGLADAFNLSASSSADLGNYITTLILGAVMITIVVVVIGVFLIILCMRIVRLWILIVMAPIAFLFYVFPGTQKYYSEWMNDLTNNLIIGPVLAFFLWLSFTIIGRGTLYEGFVDKNQKDVNPTTSPGKMTTTANVINFIIALSMLVGGLQFAAKTGGAGASFASAGAGKIKAGLQSRARRLSRPVVGGAGRATAFVSSRLASGASRLAPRLSQPGGRLSRIAPAESLLRGAFDVTRGLKQTEQAGLRARGTATRWASLGQKEEEAATAGMNTEQRKQYYASRADAFMGADAKSMLIKQKIKEGYYKDADKDAVDKDGNPDKVRRQKYTEMISDKNHLETHGGTGDDEQVTKMKLQNAALWEKGDQAELDRSIRERGYKGTFAEMNWNNVIDKQTGAMTAGASMLMEQYLKADAKVRKSILENLDKKEKDQFAKALKAFGAQVSRKEGEKGKEPTFEYAMNTEKMFNAEGKVDKESSEYKKLETMVSLDPKSTAPFFSQLSETQQDAFMKEAKSQIDGKEMAKLDIEDENQKKLFQGMSKVISGSQRTEYLGAATSKEQKKLLVQTGVQQGDIDVYMDNPTTRNDVDPADIKKYFDNSIADKVAKGKTEEDARAEVAKSNLDKAHLAYSDVDPSDESKFVLREDDFAKFANEELRKDQLLKMNKPIIDKIRSKLNPAMQEAIAQEGIGGPGTGANKKITPASKYTNVAGGANKSGTNPGGKGSV